MDPTTARGRETLALSASDSLTLFAGGESCSTRDQVRAVVRLIGDRTVWLDDIENPSGTFGGLSDIDGNGRVTILMTKKANQQDGGDSQSKRDSVDEMFAAASASRGPEAAVRSVRR